MSFFPLNFKKNFECQVWGVGQKINFFVGGGGGIKFEFCWGVSSFSGGVGGINSFLFFRGFQNLI